MSKKGNRAVKMVVVENGREIPKELQSAVLMGISDRFRARQQDRVDQTARRNDRSPERRSVALAMLSVEMRLVEAFWTIARQPASGLSPDSLNRCGLEYMAERGDLTAYSDAAGGRWQSVAPRPPIPSGREIDRANEALDWLLFVDEVRRKLLVVGATSKRGDIGRQIAWGRLRVGLPESHGLSIRTLQGRYREALRIIVNELTLARLAG